MSYIFDIVLSLIFAIALAIPWCNILDRSMRDPELKAHSDDLEYWDWP